MMVCVRQGKCWGGSLQYIIAASLHILIILSVTVVLPDNVVTQVLEKVSLNNTEIYYSLISSNQHNGT